MNFLKSFLLITTFKALRQNPFDLCKLNVLKIHDILANTILYLMKNYNMSDIVYFEQVAIIL